MKPLGLNEIREKYLSFFEQKNHLRLPSFPLVPINDKSLLLINSGMAPLKTYFTGQEIPPNKRITTCQKCIRTGDIENVGKTARHGTFFEMLGNFSFGDYFKEEIIPWSWEFVTEVMGIPVDKLYVSVYQEDDETYEIWNKKMGLGTDRIFRMGKDDNFWEVGLGPCGPCSEIYYDRGIEFGCGSETCTVGCECDRYMEFWNLVFTEFSKEEDGTYKKLEHPNIDTGMGLERMATMMQNVTSIFDVDTIKAISDHVCKIAGVEYGKNDNTDISIRIITDHIRSVVFMTADGVLPSNDGRGYVLRRLLRRAIRHGKLLGINKAFLKPLCETVIKVSKEAYKELFEKQDYIFKVILVEEERFFETLDQGMEILKAILDKNKKDIQSVLKGSDAFKLYDTYGFPLDLTKEILEEQNMTIDEEAFEKEMEAQRNRARSARSESTYMGSEQTVYNKLDTNINSVFIGYDKYETESEILAIIKNGEIVESANALDEVAIILDKTTLYAESGGQKGDNGKIQLNNNIFIVNDCIKVIGNKIVHLGIIKQGTFKVNEKVKVSVDIEKRLDTARNHTTTHLLQKALREVLGNHIEQAGSYVSSERLRFDFTHFVAMTNDEIERVEDIVNKKILESLDVNVSENTIEEARKLGATALFGEKYGKIVRVVNVSDYSIEFCGGTHLKNTSQAGTFKLMSESGVAAGVRRIEGITGTSALSYYKSLNTKIKIIGDLFKVTPENILRKVESFMLESEVLNRKMEQLNEKMSLSFVEDIVSNIEYINDKAVIAYNLEGLDINALKTIGDQIKTKLKSCVIMLGSLKDDKTNVIIMVTDDLVKSGVNAGNIIKACAHIIGGNGGGRPNMAQLGGKDYSKISDFYAKAKELVRDTI